MKPHEHPSCSHRSSQPQQEMSGASSSAPGPRMGSVYRPGMYRDPTLEMGVQYPPPTPGTTTSAFPSPVVGHPIASSLAALNSNSSSSHFSVLPHPPSTAPTTQSLTSSSGVSVASVSGNSGGGADRNVSKLNLVPGSCGNAMARGTPHHAASAGYSSMVNSISSSTSCVDTTDNQAQHHNEEEEVDQKQQVCSHSRSLKRPHGAVEKASHQGPHVNPAGVVGLDDFPSGRNPVGAGIEIGIVCPECGAVAVTSGSWSAHQAAHQGQGAVCPHCSLVFLTPHGRDLHLQQHRDPGMWEVDDFCECMLCGGSFIGVIYLELHLMEMHGQEALHNPRSFHLGPSRPCEDMDLPGEESGRQNYECGVCHALFTFRLNLDCHMAIHSEPSYGCVQCSLYFTTFDLLVDHCRLHRFSEVSPSTSFAGSHAAKPSDQTHHADTAHQAPPTHQPVWEESGEASEAPAVPRVGPAAPCTHAAAGVPFPPSVLNYYMMMSLLGAERGAASATPGFDALPWMPFAANSALTNMLSYINPYMLSNNSASTSQAAGRDDRQIKEEKDSTLANSSSSSSSESNM